MIHQQVTKSSAGICSPFGTAARGKDVGKQQARYSFPLVFDCGLCPFSEFILLMEWGWFYSWKKIPTISEGFRYSLTTQLCSLRRLVRHYSSWKQLDQTREVVPYIASHWEWKLHLGQVHCLQQAGLFLKIQFTCYASCIIQPVSPLPYSRIFETYLVL